MESTDYWKISDDYRVQSGVNRNPCIVTKSYSHNCIHWNVNAFKWIRLLPLICAFDMVFNNWYRCQWRWFRYFNLLEWLGSTVHSLTVANSLWCITAHLNVLKTVEILILATSIIQFPSISNQITRIHATTLQKPTNFQFSHSHLGWQIWRASFCCMF